MEYTVKMMKKDFLNADYLSNLDCPLAKALKRRFPERKISVGATIFCIDNVVIHMENVEFISLHEDLVNLLTDICKDINKFDDNIIFKFRALLPAL